eukprot:m.81830 g.81830  ORF g.81830 m.81830 type:complete len:458 (+) comp14583_c0_seq1:96-1469(+)
MAASAHIIRGQAFAVGERYQDLAYIGEGAYGMVVSANDTQSGQEVAIKKMILRDHLTYSKRALREIKILSRLDHECIVPIIELIADSNPSAIQEVYVVMRRMESDLHQVIRALRKKRQILPATHTCYWAYQLAKALKYMHSANVLHRDLKPQNVLINSQTDCSLAVCDFGLARVVDRDRPEKLSEYVATRWYRAPELALSLCEYTDQMDVWSFGCILAECLTGKALFPSKTALDQLNRILTLVGSPSDQDLEWIPKQATRDYVRKLQSRPRENFQKVFGGASPEAIDLLDQIFQFNPRRRPTAAQILDHPYFAVSGYRDPDQEPTAPAPLRREDADVDLHSMDQIRQEIAAEVARFNEPSIALAVAAQALQSNSPDSQDTEDALATDGTGVDKRSTSLDEPSPTSADPEMAELTVLRTQSIPIQSRRGQSQAEADWAVLHNTSASVETVAMGTTPDE